MTESDDDLLARFAAVTDDLRFSEAILRTISADFKATFPSAKLPPAPEKLFHYTSAEGFKGIVQTKSLWLTNSAYVNDSGELTFPLQLTNRTVDRVASDLGNDGADLAQEIARAVSFHDRNKVWYVACLSTEGNLLSQWRAYCSEGGYALGFDGPLLAGRLLEEEVSIIRVEYDEGVQIDVIESHLKWAADFWARRPSDLQGGSVALWRKCVARVVASHLLVAFVGFKSSAFREESEWRLTKVVPQQNAVAFRTRRGQLVPYVEVGLTAGLNELKSVTTAPIGDPVLAEHAARLLLRHDPTSNRTAIERTDYRLR